MAELVRHGQRTQRAHRVHEQRVRAVERVDITPAVRGGRPARRLHRPGDLQRQLVEVLLALVERDLALAHQPPQVPVGGDVVEAVIVHADVRHVRGHELDGLAPPDFQEALLAGGIELQQRRAELEPLRPLRPAARGVFALHRDDRRALGRLPGLLQAQNLLRREVKSRSILGSELAGGEAVVDAQRH